MDNSCVIIFPSIYSLNRLQMLKCNIKKTLELQNQKFNTIKIDGKIIVVYANDPVFASSTISMLTGINKVAIAKKASNKFNIVTDEIANVASDLLLNNEKFYIKVSGNISTNAANDIEIASTSSIISKTKNRNIKPDKEDKCDKVIYIHVTKSSAYICIFVDNGIGGHPYNSQNDKVVCCIYNKISSVACLKCVEAGFDVKIIVYYQNYSELIKLVKITNKMIARIPKKNIELEFFKTNNKIKFLDFLCISNIISIKVAKIYNIRKVLLTLSPNLCNVEITDHFTEYIYKNRLIPLLPLAGYELINNHINTEVNKLLKLKIGNIKNYSIYEKTANEIFHGGKKIIVKNDLDNTHNIIDGLKN